jgi:hypothetical protein
LNDNAASDEADAKGMEKDLMIDVNSWNSMEQIDRCIVYVLSMKVISQ